MRKLLYACIAASLSLLVGCGSGSKGYVDLKKMGIDTGQHKLSYDAQRWLGIYVENRRQHNEFQCEKQEISAMLMAASAKDSDLTDQIEIEDIEPFIKEEIQRMEAVYGGKSPGMKNVANKLP